jgi:hypothetical protein
MVFVNNSMLQKRVQMSYVILIKNVDYLASIGVYPYMLKNGLK